MNFTVVVQYYTPRRIYQEFSIALAGGLGPDSGLLAVPGLTALIYNKALVLQKIERMCPSVIGILLSTSLIIARCTGAMVFGSDTAIRSVRASGLKFDPNQLHRYPDVGVGDVRSGVEDGMARGGMAENLRRFAEGRAMKTGTTIAGVVFEVGWSADGPCIAALLSMALQSITGAWV